MTISTKPCAKCKTEPRMILTRKNGDRYSYSYCSDCERNRKAKKSGKEVTKKPASHKRWVAVKHCSSEKQMQVGLSKLRDMVSIKCFWVIKQCGFKSYYDLNQAADDGFVDNSKMISRRDKEGIYDFLSNCEILI